MPREREREMEREREREGWWGNRERARERYQYAASGHLQQQAPVRDHGVRVQIRPARVWNK